MIRYGELPHTTAAWDPEAQRASSKRQTVKKKARSRPNLELSESPGIYESVLVASFGGVRWAWGEDEVTKVHPLLLLVLAMPLFSVQVTIIGVLKFDFKLSDRVVPEDIGDKDGLLRTHILLICVMYLSNFKTLATVASRFVLVMNPFTWLETKHLEYTSVPCLNRNFGATFARRCTNWSLVPCALASIFMQSAVAGLVCIETTSIILRANTIEDAIFNSLAISFVIELDSFWWKFCMHSLHLAKFDEFEIEFRAEEDLWETDGSLSQKRLSEMCLCKCVYECTVGASRMQSVLSLLVLFGVFCRQLLCVLHAVESNKLPIARDLCELYEVSLGREPEFHSFMATWWHLIQYGMFAVNQASALDAWAAQEIKNNQTSLGERCKEYNRLGWPEQLSLLRSHWRQALISFLFWVAFLVVPPVMVAWHARRRAEIDMRQNAEISDLEDDKRFEQLAPRTARLGPPIRV